jgi:hypothetical protein
MVRRHGWRCLLIGGLLALAAASATAAPAENQPRWAETLAASRHSYQIAEIAEGATYKLPHKFIFFDSEVVRVGDDVWQRGR